LLEVGSLKAPTNAHAAFTVTWRAQKLETQWDEAEVEHRRHRVLVDNVVCGELVARPLTGPGVALAESHAVLWVGDACLLVDLATSAATLWGFPNGEPIGAVYHHGGKWVIVGELRLETRSIDFAQLIATYHYYEILLTSELHGDVLTVRALDETVVRLCVPHLERT
jgi:hypothetical protein